MLHPWQKKRKEGKKKQKHTDLNLCGDYLTTNQCNFISETLWQWLEIHDTSGRKIGGTSCCESWCLILHMLGCVTAQKEKRTVMFGLVQKLRMKSFIISRCIVLYIIIYSNTIEKHVNVIIVISQWSGFSDSVFTSSAYTLNRCHIPSCVNLVIDK